MYNKMNPEKNKIINHETCNERIINNLQQRIEENLKNADKEVKLNEKVIDQKEEIQIEEKVEHVQTWSEYYIYPYFTPEYYYVGQAATAVTLVAASAFIYWYVAPMVVSYYYGNNTNTTSNITNNIPIETKITENIHALKVLKINTEQRQEKMGELIKLSSEYVNKVKESDVYTNKAIEKIKQIVIENKNSYGRQYITQMDSGLYKYDLEDFFNHYKWIKPLKGMKRIENEAIVAPRLTNTAVINIEGTGHTDPEVLYKFATNLDQIAHALPEHLQYLPMLLTYAYNVSVCYYVMRYNIYHQIKETNIE